MDRTPGIKENSLQEQYSLASNEVYQGLQKASSVDEFMKQGYLRRTDGQFVILEGRGMEQDVASLFDPNHWTHSFLAGRHEQERLRYFENLKAENIKDRRVLVVPAYGENAFIFSSLAWNRNITS